MNRTVMIEQFHLTVRVPATLPEPAVIAIRTLLSGAGFVIRLRRAIRAALQADPALARVRLTINR
jgi:hypothetical protein